MLIAGVGRGFVARPEAQDAQAVRTRRTLPRNGTWKTTRARTSASPTIPMSRKKRGTTELVVSGELDDDTRRFMEGPGFPCRAP